jgi:hypothetical protein
MAEESGMARPFGYIRRLPAAVDSVTVVLTTTEVAFEAIPHRPWIRKTRSEFAASAGPPNGPVGWRVSTARHGVTV